MLSGEKNAAIIPVAMQSSGLSLIDQLPQCTWQLCDVVVSALPCSSSLPCVCYSHVESGYVSVAAEKDEAIFGSSKWANSVCACAPVAIIVCHFCGVLVP